MITTNGRHTWRISPTLTQSSPSFVVRKSWKILNLKCREDVLPVSPLSSLMSSILFKCRFPAFQDFNSLSHSQFHIQTQDYSTSTLALCIQCMERFLNDTILYFWLLTSNPRIPPSQELIPEPSVSQYNHEEVRPSWWWPRCISRTPETTMHDLESASTLMDIRWLTLMTLTMVPASMVSLSRVSLPLVTVHVSWWLSVSPPPGGPLLLSSHQPPAPASLQLVLASVCPVRGHRGRSVVCGDWGLQTGRGCRGRTP